MHNNRTSQSSESIHGENQSAGVRRRGETLINAVLKAAWDELQEVGYSHFTIERVAQRSNSNKTSLYRRWPQKSDLVTAALVKYLPVPSENVPDTGSLRGDILVLLHELTHLMQAVGSETIHGLMMEYSAKGAISLHQQPKDLSGLERWNTAMMTILGNAQKRGEVNFIKLHPRVISLPLDLLRNEFFTTFEPISDETATEIIDNVFLPLVKSC
ncbi:MAG: TetR/AcrR family transcriptional regulator, partial [Lacrimispora sp.]